MSDPISVAYVIAFGALVVAILGGLAISFHLLDHRRDDRRRSTRYRGSGEW